MTVYLDSVFALNLLVNYLLLLVTGKVAGEPVRRWWLALGSLVGTMFTTAAFLPGWEWLCSPACKIAAVLFMMLAAYGNSAHFLRLFFLFLALSCTLSGGVLLFSLMSGKGFSLQNGILGTSMDLKLVVCSAALCYGGMSLLFRRIGRHGPRELMPVTVSIGGRQVLLTALRDTGNTLTDPATGRPVLVAEGSRLKRLLPEGLLSGLNHPAETMERCTDPLWRQRLRLLPYRAVGVRCAFLLAVRADMVRVGGREYGGLLVALSPTPVSDGGGYQALFGE